MRRRLVKDKAAQTDLVGIWGYTFEQWSEAQADRYLGALEHGIRGLARRPEVGSARNELRIGYRSIRIEHHVVFYTFTDTEVRVRRVLHESMDARLHL